MNLNQPRPSPFPEDVRACFLVDADAAQGGCTTNPTRIDKPFWKYMIAGGSKPARYARAKLGLRPSERGAVFCFHRFGRTVTELPDGRIVLIGGEHEDFYDNDFFIYNDVVVIHGHSDGREKAMERLGWTRSLPNFPISRRRR